MDLPYLPLPTFGGKQLWGDVFLHAGFRIQRNVITGHHRLLSPSDLRMASGSWERCRAAFEDLYAQQAPAPEDRHLVLLLHGIFRSKDSFGPMTRALRRAGYDAHAINYPSTRRSLEEHADQLETLLEQVRGVSRVSFVTHSMGGIVARVLLGRTDALWRSQLEVNRLLMIGTPNQGAEIASRLQPISPFMAVAGPALHQLHPDHAAKLPIPDVPFGIVAGGRGTPQGFNPLLPGDNDMTVTVEETRLPGAEDFLLVNAVHTFIMVHPQVIEATQRYLETGVLACGEPQAP
ncbi:MAG TPA: alpha/beta fold hydrolase [Deltaproteobacteria bacterium]|nr:alpha/beta fold hydrolase [Deltaproteobacteria bacterium]